MTTKRIKKEFQATQVPSSTQRLLQFQVPRNQERFPKLKPSPSAWHASELERRPGATPLHWAAMTGRASVVPLLLAAGAAPDAVANNGPGPRSGRRPRSPWVLGWWPRGRTPLHLAARVGRVAVAEQLVAAGAAEDAVDEDGPGPQEVVRVRIGLPLL